MTCAGGPPSSGRQSDVVLSGATGFVGRLTASHLRAAGQVRVVLAGRDRHALGALRNDLGVEWPVFVTDLRDQCDGAALACSTRVLTSRSNSTACHSCSPAHGSGSVGGTRLGNLSRTHPLA